MPTTFNVIYLGKPAVDIDPTEGNTSSENLGALVGSTFGGAGNPLYDNVGTWSPVGSPGNTYDVNNNPDQFSVNGTTYRYDGGGAYNATVTYADGTTASVVAKIAQSTTGELFLTSETAGSEANQALLDAKPILSITFNSAQAPTPGMAADRLAGNFIEAVDGTAGSENMGVGYTDAGGDKVTDSADVIRSGDGNDTINAGGGDDVIYAGSGNDLIDDWSGNDLVYAGAGNDTIDVSVGSNTVYMDGGDDLVNIRDNAGTSTLFGGDGFDTIDFRNWQSSTAATVTYNADGSGSFSHFNGSTTGTFQGFERVTGSDNADTMNASATTSGVNMDGEAGNDTLTGGSGNDSVWGGTGQDSLVGNAGSDQLYGGDANDTMRGDAGNDTLYGGNGSDLGFGGDGNDSIGSWSDEGGNDTLYGDAGNDSVYGGGENDLVYGGTGDDILSGGAGNDSSFGGTGNDWAHITDDHNTDFYDLGEETGDLDGLSFANWASTNGVNVTFTGNDAGSYTYAGGFATGTFTGVEGISSTDYADTLNAGADTDGVWLYGNGGSDSLTGGSGSDSIYFGSGNDTVHGGADNDYIDDIASTAETGDNLIYGGAGTDTIWHGGGNDIVYGGDGNDYIDDHGPAVAGNSNLFGDAGDDTIWAGDGNDVVSGGADNDLLDGEAGDDSLDGGSGADQLSGGAGNDTLNGGTGADSLFGGDGNDLLVSDSTDADFVPNTLSGGSGDDTIRIGGSFNGTDSIDGGTGTDLLELLPANNRNLSVDMGAGSVADGANGAQTFTNIENVTTGGGNDTIIGDGGANVLTSGAGNDSLSGGAGNDTLYGGAGNDTLSGGTGSDSLSGGDGTDIFAVQNGFGTDTITGGESTGDADTIDLSALTTGVTLTAHSEAGSITSGADSISFSQVENLTLTNQADTVSLQYSPGTVLAGGGNDTITTVGNGHVVDGGSGNDSVTSTSGQVSVYGGSGDDSLTFGFNGRGLLDGGDGNDQLLGSANTDMIYGGSGNDTIRAGGGGADVLDGGTGADTFLVHGIGGTPGVTLGNVTISGGEADAATDTVSFASHPAGVTVTYTGSEAATFTDGVTSGQFTGVEALVTTAQNDVVNAGADSAGVNVDAGAGNDSLTGGSGNDTLSGGAGDDTLIGGTGADRLFGGDGNDLLYGGEGADSLIGGAGSDTVSYDGSASGVTVNLANGTASGGDTLSGIENVIGTSHGDNITGDAGNNALYGGAGGDILAGGTGNDLVDAGTGNDQVGVWNNEGTDTLLGGENAGDFDALWFDATSGGVHVTYTGDESGTYAYDTGGSGRFDQMEFLWSTGGNDVLEASASTGGVNAAGWDGDDRLIGGAGNDSLAGESGNDTLQGGAGNDAQYGGGGADVLSGGGGSDLLDGGAGSDTVAFTGDVTEYSFDYDPSGALIVTDSVGGRDGVDTISGVEFVEFNGVTYQLVTGDDGSNTTLQGPNDGTPSIIIAHDGADWGGGHATSDAIFGGAGNDTLDGGDGNDTLVGEGDDDLLRGDGGNDLLYGGTGNDTLVGGAGSDLISTGDGADIVVLDITGATDTVTDFNMTLVAGRTIDQLDVSELTNAQGAPLTWRDVVVTDTNGDGTGDAILSFPGGERVVLQGVRPDQVDGWREMTAIGIPCFAAGTPILTPSGPRPVETLEKGDLVSTPQGAAPVIWAGSRGLGLAELEADPTQLPIHFEPGAIGNALPLRLSPQHAVQILDVDGTPALVRAKHLAAAGLRGVRIARGVRSITYHHLLLDQHTIVQAAGAMVETMYPGRVALAAFPPAARIAIAAAIYSVRKSADAGIIDLRDLSQIYGPRCLPLLGRGDAMRACGNLTPPKPRAGSRFSGWPHLSSSEAGTQTKAFP